MKTPVDVADFGELMLKMERGEMIADLTLAQSELIRALVQTEANRGGRPKGKLTLTLAYSFDGELLEITPTIAIAKPKAVRNRTVLYVANGDQVSFQNPQQIALPLVEHIPNAPAPQHVSAAPVPVMLPDDPRKPQIVQ